NLNNGGNISGANSDTLTLSPVQPADTATYSVVVGNSYGTVTSTGAAISVGCSLRISTQPVPTTNTIGSTASFSVAVTGATGNVTYQWRKDGLALSNGGRFSGATFAVLAIAGVQAADAGSYSVVITDGCGSVTSANATLVVPVPPAPFLAWGANGYNQTNLPRGLTNLVALAAGGEHNLVLKADGTVLAWGCNSAGQTNVPAGLRNVLAVAAGWNYSLALKENGTVVGWGDNSMGQITPPSNLKNVQAIAAGYSHAIALQSDGTVVAWGDGSFGQLNIPYALTNVVAIAAGGYHSLALRADGSVLAWGENSYGQATVPSGLLNVVSVAAGFYNSYAVRGDGTLVCWGAPWYGLNQTPLLATNIVSVGAGYYHCLALKADGTLITWGNDAAGLASVPSNLKNVVLLAAGAEHSIALTAEGAGVPRLLKPVRNGNRVTMALPTLCRKTYFLEYKDSVRETFWRTLPGQPGNGGVRILTDPSATGQLRFYRLRLQ
ncbi:MAG TPA: immunoglobulin domain-containing protein, partial [Candidatus Sulfotelmatobacter sp.]|nr:immunoglobulin domain-containing protein [Candidatus Sulfotelmatobacter sp.]